MRDVERLIEAFEGCTLPRGEWTHAAHLGVALWYVTRHGPEAALGILRGRIRAYNEAMGTANTDTTGYHETLTRLYLRAIAAHAARHAGGSFTEVLALLLASPLGARDWPLRFYSRERLYSTAARHGWLEPDEGMFPPAEA